MLWNRIFLKLFFKLYVMVLEIFFFMFFPLYAYGSYCYTRCGQFEFQGLDWQDLCCEALHVATY